MIDFHTHTLLSDGVLIPAEHIRRAEVAGYRVLGISDHADLATMDRIIETLREAARRENDRAEGIAVLVGVEFTHVRPRHIAEGVDRARRKGADLVIVHGQTLAEPVEEGTNRAAIEAGADILAHPGLIGRDDAAAAAERGVMLEISAKAGHCLANGHVAALAGQLGAELLFGSDAHTPEQLVPEAKARRIASGAGLNEKAVDEMFARAEAFARRLLDARGLGDRLA